MPRTRGFVVLGYAVTALHPGIGRAPGTVDLPVQRDPMGYPMIYASSVKGAFKAECGRRSSNCLLKSSDGRIACEDCPICCCLFGHELGGSPAAGLLAVLDMVPLFFPVPSLSHGYLYITTPYLAARAASILSAIATEEAGIKDLKGFLEAVKGYGSSTGKGRALNEGEVAVCSSFGEEVGGEVYVGSTALKIVDKGLKCKDLALIEELGGLASTIRSRLVVASDKDGPLLIEKGLVRLTRVKLRVDTKTVAGQALWTEEYIPPGTVFLSGFIALTPRRNRYCCGSDKEADKCIIVDDEQVEKLLMDFVRLIGGDDCTAYAIVGGKETIGKGMLLLKLRPCRRGDEP